MKKFVLTTLFLFSCLISFSQYYKVLKLPIKPPPSKFKIDSLSYTVSDIEDNRENQSQLGEVYFGVLNHKLLLKTRFGVKRNFSIYFERGLRKTEKGDLKVKVIFNELFMREEEKHKDTSGGRFRSYGVNVSYHLMKDGGEVFLLNDSRLIDSLAKQNKYDLDDFCNHFFEKSLRKLEEFIANNPDLIGQKVNQASYRDTSLIGKINSDSSQAKKSIISNNKKEGTEEGEIKLTIKKNRKIKYKSRVKNEELKQAISETYANEVHGKYIISYKIDTTKSTAEVKDLTTIDYNQSFNVSPYYYIVVPFMLIMSTIAAAQ